MTEKTWFWTCNILPEFSELKGTEHNWPGMVSQKHHRFTIIINLPSLYCLNFWNFLLLCFQPGSDWFFFLLSLQNDRPTVQIQSNWSTDSERARGRESIFKLQMKEIKQVEDISWNTLNSDWTLCAPCSSKTQLETRCRIPTIRPQQQKTAMFHFSWKAF